MANYLAQGNKTVKCTRCGNMCTIPFQKTVHQCPHCNKTTCVFFFGTVTDKYGNYIPYHIQ